jgi:hypothetical protein
MEHS